MDARSLIRRYLPDNRLFSGTYFPQEAASVKQGETIGVVLLGQGGPLKRQDVGAFLYNVLMDPAATDLPLFGVLRHWVAQMVSSVRAKSLSLEYEAIGGSGPIFDLNRDQARALEDALNKKIGSQFGIQYRTYLAMRHWKPTFAEVAEEMLGDGVAHVVLLPLYPQYAASTTGSMLLYWWMLQDANVISRWPTTQITEYATHPKYIQALNERIDEGLQRFPKEVRDRVHLVFTAHDGAMDGVVGRGDAYRELLEATVLRTMKGRKVDHPYHISYHRRVGQNDTPKNNITDKIKALAQRKQKAALIIPVSYVHDVLETTYELDVEVRRYAEKVGLTHYEVTAGLNTHSLFIDALAELVLSQCEINYQVRDLRGPVDRELLERVSKLRRVS